MAPSRMRLRKIDTALLVAGSAAAVFAVAAIAAEIPEKLEDVQIGERGDILRVALICSTRCDLAPGAGVDFRINGVTAALDVDLTTRSALAERLTIEPRNGASVISLKTAMRVNAARVVACKSDTGVAPCIEYRFEKAPAADVKPAAAPAPRPQIRDKSVKAAPPADDIPFIGAVILAPGPLLRDEPAAGLIYIPRFGPPERLKAPQTSSAPSTEDPQGDDLAGEAPGSIPAGVDIRRPSLVSVDRAQALGGAGIDIRREAGGLLGKAFSVGACEGAKARLMGDAWALDAMIDLAFCKAGDGKLDEADADFARLLAYTPDNYEALVGRGLIALARGDRKTGAEFYQEALNALPPIAESDRIVEAMRRL